MDLMERVKNTCVGQELCNNECPLMDNGHCVAFDAPYLWDLNDIRDRLIEAQFHFNDVEDCRL